MERKVTRLANIHRPNDVSHEALAHIVAELRESERLQRRTDSLRSALQKGDQSRFDKGKLELPAVLFSGIFKSARTDGLTSHSGLVVLDFDGLQMANVLPMNQRLGNDPHTVLAFVSPSGSGLKWVVPIVVREGASHGSLWEIAAEYAQRNFGLSADSSGKDVSRKCFLCHDPALISKNEAVPFECKNIGASWVNIETLKHGNAETLNNIDASFSPASPNEEREQPQNASHISQEQLAPFIPTGPKQNNHLLFDLCREGKRIEKARGYPFTFDEKLDLGGAWHRASPPEFRPHSLEHYEGEFLGKWDKAQFVAGFCPLHEAERLLMTEPAPPEANQYAKHPSAFKLVCLMYQLARITNNSFLLTCRDAGRVMGINHSAAFGWMLEMEGNIIACIQRGSASPRRANRYRWLGEIRP